MGLLKRRIIEAMEPTEYELARRWIPVEERLPEEERVVLICHRGTVGMARLYSDGWYWDMDEWHKPFTPTHWMSLPEPPEVIDDEMRALHEVARQIAKTKHPGQTLGDVLFKRRPEPPEVK